MGEECISCVWSQPISVPRYEGSVFLQRRRKTPQYYCPVPGCLKEWQNQKKRGEERAEKRKVS